MALLAVGGLMASLAWLRRTYLVVTVDGPSMEPTLKAGDRLLTRRAAAAGELRKGQIVVLLNPARRNPGSSAYLIKRVAALPGQAQHLTDPVPPGQIFVLGDNLAESRDSRAFGPVSYDHVVAVMVRPLAMARLPRPAG